MTDRESLLEKLYKEVGGVLEDDQTCIQVRAARKQHGKGGCSSTTVSQRVAGGRDGGGQRWFDTQGLRRTSRVVSPPPLSRGR